MAFKEHENSLNENKSLKGRFCSRPFSLLEIQKEFYGYACCPSWLPAIVGNCQQTSIEKVWNSETIQLIRKSILDGSFSYCDHKECPEIQSGKLPRVTELKGRWREIYDNQIVELDHLPDEIALCYDESCNLACPSCRSEKKLDIRGPSFEKKLLFTQSVIELINSIKDKDKRLLLRVTGSGDPFGSPLYFKLLQEINGEMLPNLQICIQTNGVLLTPSNWARIGNIHRNVVSISISIDAATKETYETVRKLGKWDRLMANLQFVKSLREESPQIKALDLNFVVQKSNYFEMPAFVHLALGLDKVTRVFFSFVNDWGTWSKKDYIDQCIWKTDHKEFGSFMSVLQDPILSHPIVHLGNLSEYRARAIGKTSQVLNESI